VGAADGEMLVEELDRVGVNTSLIRRLDCPTGHAVIQIDQTLEHFSPGDLLVLQNEISSLAYLLEAACKRGMRVTLNPSPMTDDLLALPLEKVRFFFVNEIEASQICGGWKNPMRCLDLILQRCPDSGIILTLGSQGCIYQDAHQRLKQPACPVEVVDTTAAGDTFSGFFLAQIVSGAPVRKALEIASKAVAIAVSRKGAASSIPSMEDVQAL